MLYSLQYIISYIIWVLFRCAFTQQNQNTGESQEKTERRGERRDTKEQFQKLAGRGREGSRIEILNRAAIYDARAKFLHVTLFPFIFKK